MLRITATRCLDSMSIDLKLRHRRLTVSTLRKARLGARDSLQGSRRAWLPHVWRVARAWHVAGIRGGASAHLWARLASARALQAKEAGADTQGCGPRQGVCVGGWGLDGGRGELQQNGRQPGRRAHAAAQKMVARLRRSRLLAYL
jgi:hypothetical protein